MNEHRLPLWWRPARAVGCVFFTALAARAQPTIPPALSDTNTSPSASGEPTPMQTKPFGELFKEGVLFANDQQIDSAIQRFTECDGAATSSAQRAQARHNLGIAHFKMGATLDAENPREALARAEHAERLFSLAIRAARESKEVPTETSAARNLEITRLKIRKLRDLLDQQQKQQEQQREDQQEQQQQRQSESQRIADELRDLADKQQQLSEQASKAESQEDVDQLEHQQQSINEQAERLQQQMQETSGNLPDETRQSMEDAQRLVRASRQPREQAEEALERMQQPDPAKLDETGQNQSVAAKLLQLAAEAAQKSADQQMKKMEQQEKGQQNRDDGKQHNAEKDDREKRGDKGKESEKEQEHSPVDQLAQDLLKKEQRDREQAQSVQPAFIVPVPKVEKDW